MNAANGLPRRAFVERIGGGIVMLLATDPRAVLAQSPARLYPEDFNAYLAIGTDGRVTATSARMDRLPMTAERVRAAIASAGR